MTDQERLGELYDQLYDTDLEQAAKLFIKLDAATDCDEVQLAAEMLKSFVAQLLYDAHKRFTNSVSIDDEMGRQIVAEELADEAWREHLRVAGE